MLGILKKKQPEKEKEKELPKEELPLEEKAPETPKEEIIKAPEAMDHAQTSVKQEPEPPFASWNENISDEEIPMPPPFMSQKAPEKPVQNIPIENKPFNQSNIKGPVFLSLSKYHEVKSMLFDLKKSSAELRDILAGLKKNRDGGTSLLEQSVERLSTIENRLEEISATLRAG